MYRMHNPPHPGGTLREDILPALKLSVSEAARQLGVSRVQLSRVINERAAITPELALRIEAWLTPAHGGRAEVWLNQQASYDLWQAQQKPRPRIQPAIIPGEASEPSSEQTGADPT